MHASDAVGAIKGVGPKTAALFEKLHIYTVEDLLLLYPRAYLTYDAPISISMAREGDRVAVQGSIQSTVDVRRTKNRILTTCMVGDRNDRMKLIWFHSPYLKHVFHIGQRYIFVGTVVKQGNQLVMEHPEYYTVQQYEELERTLRPVYPLTEGLSNKTVTKAVKTALSCLEDLDDRVSDSVLEQFALPKLATAVKGVHFPENTEELIACRRRFVFDEFFEFLLKMRMVREHTVRLHNTHPVMNWDTAEMFLRQLPYKLTQGQTDAVAQIRSDMSGRNVMNRLVQGDVGSGKTVVALTALLATVSNGYQGAFMVPTEVLAAQHFETVSDSLAPFGVRAALLCGSTKLAEKRRIYRALKDGTLDVVVGTHALIQEKVVYRRLGLVITDEQHRFGVRQREALAEKGDAPHVLVMSATPIPRTLAVILYGDLDISVMRDMPANRKPIKNCVVGPEYRPTAYRFMLEQIQKGHQIYIICPMVEAAEKASGENVVDYHAALAEVFPESVRIEHLHGKMTAEEKMQIMERFAAHKTDILISTTVIEVGIDNPNATVIMIENAEKFGLAQLHQLRGRVGRGQAQSYCIMLCGTDQKEAHDRLQVLNTSNDGFYIANEDLRMRGPGDFFGVRQSGDVLFRMGDIYQDADILKTAQDALLVCERTNLLPTLYEKWGQEERMLSI